MLSWYEVSRVRILKGFIEGWVLQVQSICAAHAVRPFLCPLCIGSPLTLCLNLKRALTGSKAQVRAPKYSLPSAWPLGVHSFALYHILEHLPTGPEHISSDWSTGVG